MYLKCSNQRGFTLVELLIVVAIIGILASIAVPAYRDYTIRARVSESANLFNVIKTETKIYYSENALLPDSIGELASLGRISATVSDYTGDYVSYLDIGDSGIVTVKLQDKIELGPASLGEVVFTPVTTGNTINWTVSGNGLDSKYLPTLN
jgi:type IV pilus assembly protein PilA